MLWLRFRTGSSEYLRLANAISDKLAQFSSGSNTRMEQNGKPESRAQIYIATCNKKEFLNFVQKCAHGKSS